MWNHKQLIQLNNFQMLFDRSELIRTAAFRSGYLNLTVVTERDDLPLFGLNPRTFKHGNIHF